MNELGYCHRRDKRQLTEADARATAAGACTFELAWRGKCGQPTAGRFCEEHMKARCVSCGEQATQECDMASSLVCGCFLCDLCDHEFDKTPEGWYKGVHRRKTNSPPPL